MRTAAAILLASALALPVGAGAEPTPPTYEVVYDARIVPTERAAKVTIRISDPDDHLRSIEFQIDPERHRDFTGDGLVEVSGSTVRWEPVGGKARLQYVFRIDHLRDAQSYDARCAEKWAIFRGDDLVPPARVRAAVGAESRASLRLRVPEGWSVVTPYPRAADGIHFAIEHEGRRFDRPTGWITAGKLGVVRERVAGVQVAVAGPVGQRLHRLDLLALLRWTLPSLQNIVPDGLPPRLLVVGAGDPMWRGGLSGPRSVFVHATRPLMSEDGTSPVLHEIVHATLGIRPGPGGDWVVEGLAELYSLELLVRSRTISRKRFEKALARLAQRGRSVRRLSTDAASGAVTARAVTVLRALDQTIRAGSEGRRNLDDVMRILAERRSEVTTAELRAIAEQVTGTDLTGFFRREVGTAG